MLRASGFLSPTARTAWLPICISLVIGAALLTPSVWANEDLLLWSTFLGGTGYYDESCACAHDADGNVVVVGLTSSQNLPVTAGGFDVTYNGSIDGFVAKLSADGSQLLWCTYLGGSELDWATAVAVDAEGNVVVAGWTDSPNFPVTPGAFDEMYNYGEDAYVAKLSSTGGELLWSTFLGGIEIDRASAVALDAGGEVVVAGTTTSRDFPTTPGAFDRTFAGGTTHGYDGFACRLSASGASLVWSTFLGGPEAYGYPGDDTIASLLLDATGCPIVAGTTSSPEFPTTAGAFDPTFNDSEDGFITKLAEDGAALVWSSYFGGSLGDDCSDIAWSGDGHLLVCGQTYSADLPTTPGVYQPTFGGGRDAYAAKIDNGGSAVPWCSYLGTPGAEAAYAIVGDAYGTAIVTGRTNSASFPVTPDAFDPAYNNGMWDTFLSRFDSQGRHLLWSSYLGGIDRDEVRDLATYGYGVVVLGHTLSSDYPTTPGAFDETHNGGYDVCASRFALLNPAAVGKPVASLDEAAVLGLPTPIPFVDQVVIRCGAVRSGLGAISIHDPDGRLVRADLPIVESGQSGYAAVWDGRADDGRQVGNGVYFVTLHTATGPQSRRVLRLK